MAEIDVTLRSAILHLLASLLFRFIEGQMARLYRWEETIVSNEIGYLRRT